MECECCDGISRKGAGFGLLDRLGLEAARDSATENPGSEVAATTFKTDLLIVVSGDMPKRPMCCNHPAISPLTV